MNTATSTIGGGAQDELGKLRAKLAETEARLSEAEEVIRAIQSGEVDALVVSGPEGTDQVFTLRGAESGYRALVEAMNEGAATLGADGSILYCNQRLADLLGVPLELVIGKPAAEFVAPGSKPAFEDLLNRAFLGDAVTGEMEVCAAGSERRTAVHISIRRMKTDGHSSLSMVVTDQTEARKREQLIAAERQRLFAILEALPAMTCLLSPDHRVIFANRLFRERFGDTNGRHCHESCFGNAEPCGFCESFVPLTTGKPHRWEVNAPDGSVIDAFDMPFTDADGSSLILEMDMDITERRRTEAELQMHRENLARLVSERTSQLETAMARLTEENAERMRQQDQLKRANRTLAAHSQSNQALLHAEDEAALLNEVCKIIGEHSGHAMAWIGLAENDNSNSIRLVAFAGSGREYLENLRTCWNEEEEFGKGPTGLAIRTGKPHGCPDIETASDYTPWRRRALAFGYRSSLALPLVLSPQLAGTVGAGGPDLPDGRVLGAISIYSTKVNAFSPDEIRLLSGLASDLAFGLGIQRLKAIHAQAEQALIRTEKLASLGRMAATIAHEINNPLAAVTNLVFLASASPELPKSSRGYLRDADSELKRVAHIVRQSLGFYRESTAADTVSVPAILDSALDLLANKIAAKNATIRKKWPADLKIVAVAGELRQVFSNLLSNSLDALEQNGIVSLQVKSIARPGREGEWIRISIADNGCGMGPDVRRHLFEPLFSTKGDVGTGLGLWVSKQIVDKHGGAFRVRSFTSARLRGSVFSIFLPVARETDD
jgi:PAS domain S-box-containing protein